MKRLRSALIFALLSLLAACSSGSGSGSPPPTKSTPRIAVNTVVTGLNSPVDLQTPDDNTNRLFVVEQGGTIRIIQNNAIAAAPFLDISTKITLGSETGLLGIAFHPTYVQNGRFYLNYNRTIGAQLQTVIAEYKVSTTDANVADPNSERILLVVNQPFTNHKAGQLAFGADGFLYFGLGDGGGAGDPNNNGQNTFSLLGKMLRIDVSQSSTLQQYGIPSDNPFVSSGGRQEIYAVGFRNPWRFSFDTPSGRLFVADVGQDNYEEIDIVTKGGNYGWNTMEGAHCFQPATGCNMTGLTLPIAEYTHAEGIAVIGGYVYHGTAVPNLQGAYVFGDYGSGTIWMLQETTSNNWTRTQLASTGKNLSAFGQDQAGELYVLDYSGSLLKIQSP